MPRLLDLYCGAGGCSAGYADAGFEPGEYVQVVGHFSGVPQAREAMEIDWMGQKELAQAIPPAYTRYIGRTLLKHIQYPVFVKESLSA